MEEQVNHPKHYNAREDGLECIDIIRHYTCDIANALKYLWRAGLKVEMGKPNRKKEIEDLKKAIWYIKDQIGISGIYLVATMNRIDDEDLVERLLRLTGKSPSEIAAPYPEPISDVVFNLLHVGLIDDCTIYCTHSVMPSLRDAIADITERIIELEQTAG